jgi:hypothetical protein
MKNGLIIDLNGNEYYYKDDLLHRKDGPAVEFPGGYQAWYVNNLLHRYGGPAITFAGEEMWYINGKRHREDGPAIKWANGAKYWFLDDKQIDCKDNEEFLKMMKYKWLL